MCSINHLKAVVNVVALCSIALSAGAQSSQSQTTGVIRAALVKARTLAPDGPTAIGFADTLAISSAQAKEIGGAINATPKKLRDVRVCSAPHYCHLIGAKVFIQVFGLSVAGDSARVELTIMDDEPHGHDLVHHQGVTVTLVREAGTWRATGVIRGVET